MRRVRDSAMIPINDVLDFVVGATWVLRFTGVEADPGGYTDCIGAPIPGNMPKCGQQWMQNGQKLGRRKRSSNV